MNNKELQREILKNKIQNIELNIQSIQHKKLVLEKELESQERKLQNLHSVLENFGKPKEPQTGIESVSSPPGVSDSKSKTGTWGKLESSTSKMDLWSSES